tara:strand:+ start:979 stop:1206 length:228 start_codon:yes stop_codon:yes gene_type:complete
MNLEILTLGGYGQFVWPAFIFTFACCFLLYLKTKKELNKQEKLFLLEHNQELMTKDEVAKQKRSLKNTLSRKLIY